MEIDPAALSRREAYQLMIACVIPRPIAWLSTVSAEGQGNLAPFSFFGGVTSDPPTVMVSIGKVTGARKHTADNLLATREGVLHIPTMALAEKMVASAAAVPREVDELALVGLTRVPSSVVRPARIAEAPLALEVVVAEHREWGRAKMDLFLLEVVRVHCDDALLVDGVPDPARLDPVGRLGGQLYSGLAPFPVARPG